MQGDTVNDNYLPKYNADEECKVTYPMSAGFSRQAKACLFGGKKLSILLDRCFCADWKAELVGIFKFMAQQYKHIATQRQTWEEKYYLLP